MHKFKKKTFGGVCVTCYAQAMNNVMAKHNGMVLTSEPQTKIVIIKSPLDLGLLIITTPHKQQYRNGLSKFFLKTFINFLC